MCVVVVCPSYKAALVLVLLDFGIIKHSASVAVCLLVVVYLARMHDVHARLVHRTEHTKRRVATLRNLQYEVILRVVV